MEVCIQMWNLESVVIDKRYLLTYVATRSNCGNDVINKLFEQSLPPESHVSYIWAVPRHSLYDVTSHRLDSTHLSGIDSCFDLTDE